MTGQRPREPGDRVGGAKKRRRGGVLQSNFPAVNAGARIVSVFFLQSLIFGRQCFLQGAWGWNARRTRQPWADRQLGWSDAEFRRRFRVTRSRFNMIVADLRSQIWRDPTKGLNSSGGAISPEYRAAITLRLLAGCDVCGVADMANISHVSGPGPGPGPGQGDTGLQPQLGPGPGPGPAGTCWGGPP